MKKVLILIFLVILSTNMAECSNWKMDWEGKEDFVQGVLADKTQVNFNAEGVCDASRFLHFGFDYPLNTNGPGVCTICVGPGDFGVGESHFVSYGQDTFSECDGVDCSGFYIQTGTESPTDTEGCYNRQDEPASTHDCDGSGSCQSPSDACSDNPAEELQYSCGRCQYIDDTLCTGTTLGSCSNYMAGTDTGTCRECDGLGGELTPADDSACGTIDCDGLDDYYITGTQESTSTSYCKLDDYDDITSNRCEGLGDCKDDNTGDCADYTTSTTSTAGTCEYINGCVDDTPGSVAYYSDGTDSGTCKVCDGSGGERTPSDDGDCGTIDCDGKNYYFTSGSASVTSTNYCMYRNYADITSNRCEGFGDCKDDNSGDCTSYSDSTAASCGVCEYAQGACSSCSYYGAGTDSGLCSECDGSGGEQVPADDSGCGTIDCDGLDEYYITGTQSATTTSYCKYDDYNDITTNRCEGLGNCKDDNTGDCTDYSTSTTDTAGTCKYIDGCSGSTLPSVENYAAGTDCGSGKECDGNGNCVELLVNGDHTVSDCVNQGGTVVQSGSNKFCRFNQHYCPSYWSNYQDWSTTSPNTCTSRSAYEGTCEYDGHWITGPSCYGTDGEEVSCTTASHSWSNTPREECTSKVGMCLYDSGCYHEYWYYHCDANIDQIGCY